MEELIEYGINLYKYEKDACPIYTPNHKDDKIINLLLISSSIIRRKIEYFVYINNLNILGTQN